MPREFIPSPSTPEQLLRDLLDHVMFPVPTALRVQAERADVHDEIRTAEATGDVDRAKALREANADLLDEDRESVLERWIGNERRAGEQGDRAAAQSAARHQLELDELRRIRDDQGVEDPGFDAEDVDIEPSDGDGVSPGKEGEPS